MEERTVCYWKHIGSNVLKDSIQAGKWALVIGLFIGGCVVAFFAGIWIVANLGAALNDAANWIFSNGNPILWGIVGLYVLTPLVLKLYQGAPSDCSIPWAIGLIIALFSYCLAIAFSSPQPVPQLLILVFYGPVLFGLRYAWLKHTAAVRFCEEQDRLTHGGPGARPA